MKRKIAVVLLALCLALPGMGNASSEGAILTSFYPIYILTANLIQGIPDVSLTNLAAPEVGCLHDYRLTTADMKALSKADVFIVNGAGMESFLTDVAAQFGGLKQIVATEGIPLEEDGNAHVWLSAKGAALMAENIALGLADAFPEHSEAITANLQAYLDRLAQLDETLLKGLEPVQGKDIVTFHEAFPYFAKAYGLNVAAVIEREPGEALNPKELKELVDIVRDLHSPPLFIEPQYPDLAATTLAAETGAKVYTLDPIVTGPLGQEALTYYEQIMLQNMETLLDALAES